MAKIFISYSQKDKKFVLQYAELLREYGHTILMDDTLLKAGGEMQHTLKNAIREADGTVVFFTNNSIQSGNVNSEAGMARTYMDENNKFLIPVVKGSLDLPYTVRDLYNIQIENKTAKESVKKIHDAISGRFNKATEEAASVEELPADSYETASASAGTPPVTDHTDLPVQYWFVKTDEPFVKDPGVKAGYEGSFPIKHGGATRPDIYFEYALIRKGDLGVAFDELESQGLIFLFEITNTDRLDKAREARIDKIGFKITAVASPPLTIESLDPNLFIDKELYKVFTSSERKLYPLSAEDYKIINSAITSVMQHEVQPNDPLPVTARSMALSEVFSDSATKDIKDQLGFEGDVNALAAVIAYRDVKPPLAIGLFGNWGSGKSFFMNKLQQRIDELTKDPGNVFCKKVLAVNFNSWHYSDSNLWASLITKIFEELEGYGKQEEVHELFQKLNSTRELLQETQQDKERIDKEIDVLKDQKKIFDAHVEAQASQLNSLSVKDILTDLMTDTSVQRDFDTLKKEYAFLDLKDYDDIDANLKKLEGFGNKARESGRLFFSMVKGKKIWALIFTFLVAAGVIILVANSGIIKKYIGEYTGLISAISGSLVLLLKFLQPAIAAVNKVHARLQSLDVKVQALRAKAEGKFAEEKEALGKKLAAATVAAEDNQRKIELLEVEQAKLQHDIDDIVSGKKIIRFIESRVADVRYTSSLGIISWVRKDFEQLDELLGQQKQALQMAGPDADKTPVSFELERIILYIDDLDRCNEDIVVRVLEAIHLLLAFPLFIVVVGVDPRWMHRALNTYYAKYLSNPEQGDTDANAKMPGMENGHAASSYDYLEKIFQIPFALKPMDNMGKKNLIRSQTEKKPDVRTPDEKETPDVAPLPGKPDDAVIIDDGLPVPQSANTRVLLPGKAPVINEKAPEIIKPEALILMEDEISFMEELGFLIGESPRTIKRYINIYRIIRTHAMFINKTGEEKDYCNSMMFMLSVITGLPEEAKSIFDSIENAKPADLFSGFLTQYLSSIKSRDARLMQLQNRLQDNRDKLNLLGKISMDKFQVNAELACRFSFRNVY